MGSRLRGAFIVFEGCDKTGKNRSSDLGKFIDCYLKREVEMEPKEAHLVFAANRQALMPLMMKKLLQGTHLVVDRYAYSGIAYTLAKGADNITIEWAKLADMGELRPDCVIYFNLSFEEAQKGRDLVMNKKVDDVMKKLAIENTDLWKIVDASLPVEEISENVWKMVAPVLDNAKKKSLMFL
ncbi:hypothetical protein DINM_004962 [Dirofilaria immitis]|nr:hypothetical protein [Dirofilaria immitis]